MTSDETKPWATRLKNESQKAFTYFNTYVNLGPNRSLSKTRAEHNNDISLNQLKKYSSKYKWVERASQKDEYDVSQKNKFLKEEQEEYFEKRRHQLDQYHQATDAVLGQLMVDLGLIPNPQTNEYEPKDHVSSTTVANSIQNLSNANAITTKLALRFLGLPETINATQEIDLNADVQTDLNTQEIKERYAEFNEAIMDSKFIEKQLNIVNDMIDNDNTTIRGNSKK